MSQREGTVKCGVCDKMTPAAFADRHHITPQATGKVVDNSDDNLIWLCSGCHQNLHALSHYLLKGRIGEAKDLADTEYDSAVSVRKILEYAGHVAKEIIAMREGERDLPALVSISFEVPRHLYTTLKLMSLERRGHRQLTPFIREHLALLASKCNYDQSENDLPQVDTIDFA